MRTIGQISWQRFSPGTLAALSEHGMSTITGLPFQYTITAIWNEMPPRAIAAP
jgi:hypothetical protein